MAQDTPKNPNTGPLSPDEAALLRDIFPTIYREHRRLVRSYLRKWPLARHEVDELHQETFLTLHCHILEHGFPDNLPAMLTDIAWKKLANHSRVKKRIPPFTCYPSSTSEKPRSQLNAERALERHELAHKVFQSLSPEHQQVIQMILLDDLTYAAAAAALGLPEGTVKSRLLAAKRALDALAKALPPSQR